MYVRVVQLKNNTMPNCAPTPDNIRLYVDDVLVPLEFKTIGNPSTLRTKLPFRILVDGEVGRTVKVEVRSTDIPLLHKPPNSSLDCYGGYDFFYNLTTNPTQCVHGNPTLITVQPGPAFDDEAGFIYAGHLDPTGSSTQCDALVYIRVTRTACSPRCKYTNARVPSSRILGVFDMNNKYYELEGYQYIGCSKADETANSDTANAIKKEAICEGITLATARFFIQ